MLNIQPFQIKLESLTVLTNSKPELYNPYIYFLAVYMNRLNKFSLTLIIFAIATLLVSGLLAFKIYSDSKVAYKELEVQQQSNKNTAVQDCFKATENITREGDDERSEPVFYLYILCMEDKGYTTNFK